MDRKLLVILGVGAAVIAATMWWYYPRLPRVAPHEARYLYCPTCMREVQYKESLAESDCLRCGAGHPLVPAKESLKAGPPPGVWSVLLAPLLVELCVMFAVVLAYVSYFKRVRAKEEEYLYTECGKCQQRLRYAESKVGRAGICPRCRRGLVFPPRAGEAPPGPWWKDWSWLKKLVRGA
jgi:hypothetical protein